MREKDESIPREWLSIARTHAGRNDVGSRPASTRARVNRRSLPNLFPTRMAPLSAKGSV